MQLSVSLQANSTAYVVKAEVHVQIMSESAGMVVRLLDPQPGEQILDACAAPGSKTLFAASFMQAQVWSQTSTLVPQRG